MIEHISDAGAVNMALGIVRQAAIDYVNYRADFELESLFDNAETIRRFIRSPEFQMYCDLDPENLIACLDAYVRRLETPLWIVVKEKHHNIWWVTKNGEKPTLLCEHFNNPTAAAACAAKQQGVHQREYTKMLRRDGYMGARKPKECELIPPRITPKKFFGTQPNLKNWASNNDKRCGGCIYYCKTTHACEYYLIMKERRKCPAGEYCIRRVMGDYIGISEF